MASEAKTAKPGRGKNPVPKEGHLPVNEVLGQLQGANSPFGDDVSFPLPVDRIAYRHPDAHTDTHA